MMYLNNTNRKDKRQKLEVQRKRFARYSNYKAAGIKKGLEIKKISEELSMIDDKHLKAAIFELKNEESRLEKAMAIYYVILFKKKVQNLIKLQDLVNGEKQLSMRQPELL